MNIQIVAVVFFGLAFTNCDTQQTKEDASQTDIAESTKTVEDSDSAVKNENDDKLKIDFLKTFYNEYIPEFANSIDYDYCELLLDNACTKELLEKIESSGIHYDPFLNAQDAHENQTKSLKVMKCGDGPNQFCVSYLSGYEDRTTNIELLVSIIDGTPKIVDIIGL